MPNEENKMDTCFTEMCLFFKYILAPKPNICNCPSLVSMPFSSFQLFYIANFMRIFSFISKNEGALSQIQYYKIWSCVAFCVKTEVFKSMVILCYSIHKTWPKIILYFKLNLRLIVITIYWIIFTKSWKLILNVWGWLYHLNYIVSYYTLKI